MVTEFANYNHNKKHEFSLTISCFFVFMTATASYLPLPGMLFFLTSAGYVHIPLHEHHKEINFVTTLSFSTLSSGI